MNHYTSGRLNRVPRGTTLGGLKGRTVTCLLPQQIYIYRSNKKKLKKGYRGKNRIPGRSKKIENGKK